MTGVRMAIGALALSAAGLVGIVLTEGYTDTAVIPVPGDVATIGFGTTDGVRLGDRTTPPAALARALTDVQRFEGALRQCVKVPLSQAEYDVYVDHAYNVGSAAFCGSTIVSRLNAGDYRGACDAILMWKFFRGQNCSAPGNKVCWGLWERRLKAHAKCIGAQP